MKKIFLILLVCISTAKSFGQVTVIPKTEGDLHIKEQPKDTIKKVEKPVVVGDSIKVQKTADIVKDSIKIPVKMGLVKITATIENRHGDYIYIKIDKKKTKKIKINRAGFFEDTIGINEGFYQFYDGLNFADLYVKDGYDMIINVDAGSFVKTLAFSGSGATENNFMATSRILDTRLDMKSLMNMKYNEFKDELDKKRTFDFNRLKNASFDERFNVFQQQKTELFIKSLENFYKNEHQAEDKTIKIEDISYQYVDYEGKMIKTKSFSGSYLFIQVWSMESGASVAEAPYLREIIRKYSPQGFTFINICIDNPAEVDKWKAYIDDQGLTGVQLLADAGWKSEIINDFKISSLPRYILADPVGKLMQPNAPRPSNPNLRVGFEQLLNGGYEEEGK
jgi:hypothetical protein